MKEQIYQNGFYALLGFIIGALCFYRTPSEPQPQIEKVYVHDTITVEKHITLNEKNVMNELKRQGVKHPDIVLAQAKLESNDFKSSLVKSHNNFLGIKNGKKYANYVSWNHCIADYKKRVQNKYKGGDYYVFLRKIGYAEDPEYVNKLKRINC